MRVLMISKACVMGTYQRKLEEIAAQPDIELTVVVPPTWRDERGTLTLERLHTDGYHLRVEPIVFNGKFHWYFHPGLRKVIAAEQPEVIHIDEEPYNLATWHALRLARRAGIPALFFTWQNLERRYPSPHRWMERYVLRNAAYGIAGTQEAAEVCRAKGYQGGLSVIPQFGVDPDIYYPGKRETSERFTIGYVGRLVKEKGIDLLLEAAARLDGEWRVMLAGGGPQRAALEKLSEELDNHKQVTFEAQMPSNAMPAFYQRLDALVLPSRTQANWKEQFGRVLVEAMASGVPVIGSDSGAIPGVVGEAGLIFAEGDVQQLSAHLSRLKDDEGLRRELVQRGRQRVLAHFTQAQVAEQSVQVYREVVGS